VVREGLRTNPDATDASPLTVEHVAGMGPQTQGCCSSCENPVHEGAEYFRIIEVRECLIGCRLRTWTVATRAERKKVLQLLVPGFVFALGL